MLVHVACKANINRGDGLLTYRATDTAQPGQLVMVRLRGRRVPGVVTAVNVPAGTSQAILPVLSQSDNLLPLTYLKWLASVADWYALPLSTTLAQLAPNLNSQYLKNASFPPASGPQRLWITPAITTPLARFLAPQTKSLPEKDVDRRLIWQRARQGDALNLCGTTALLGLPFANLTELTLETPFASPYYSDRAPGLHAAVLACLLARAHDLTLQIRTSIPRRLLAERLPLPDKIKLIPPKYQPIELIPQAARGQLNADLIGAIRIALDHGQRVLVYHNHLPGLTTAGRPVGLKQLATRLGASLDCPVGVVTAQAPIPDAPVVVATATSLYRLADQFKLIVVPDVDGLASANQPWSNLVALDTLAVLASRARLIAQGRDLSHPLNQALAGQLQPDILNRLDWPGFTGRLVRLKLKEAPNCPPNWSVIHQAGDSYYLRAPRQLTENDRAAIAAWRSSGRVWTDEWTWPPISDIVAQS